MGEADSAAVRALVPDLREELRSLFVDKHAEVIGEKPAMVWHLEYTAQAVM
ncbi:MAG: hypothetical protein JOZ19_02690 [Rubrobacter sp.]|nr:hypothetical protein [Rubrobacter sp.]